MLQLDNRLLIYRNVLQGYHLLKHYYLIGAGICGMLSQIIHAIATGSFKKMKVYRAFFFSLFFLVYSAQAGPCDEIAALQPDKAIALRKTIVSAVAAGAITLYGLIKCAVSDYKLENYAGILMCKTFLPLKWCCDHLFDMERNSTYCGVDAPLPTFFTMLTTAAGGIAAYFVHHAQPETIYEKAQAMLIAAMEENMLQKMDYNDALLVPTINQMFIKHDFPRVAGYTFLIQQYEQLEEANKLFIEVKEKTGNQVLIGMAERCLQKSKECMEDIELCLEILRSAHDWQDQLAGYNLLLSREANEEAVVEMRRLRYSQSYPRLVLLA